MMMQNKISYNGQQTKNGKNQHKLPVKSSAMIYYAKDYVRCRQSYGGCHSNDAVPRRKHTAYIPGQCRPQALKQI